MVEGTGGIEVHFCGDADEIFGEGWGGHGLLDYRI